MSQCVCGGFIVANGLCACGYTQTQRHTHRPGYMPNGQKYCQDCAKILVDPILETDDLRLNQVANLLRPAPVAQFEWQLWPLPVMLVNMYEFGMAPPAEYVEEISALHRPANMDEWLDIFDWLNMLVSKSNRSD